MRFTLTMIFLVIVDLTVFLMAYFFSNIGIDILTLISVLIAINFFFVNQSIKERNRQDKQLSILKSISIRIDLLKTKSQGFKTEITEKHLSPYNLDELNVEFYLQNIDYEINRRKTDNVLKLLSKINDKITLLNDYNRNLKNCLAAFRKFNTAIVNESKRIIDEDLKTLIDEIEKELKNFRHLSNDM